MLIPGGWMHSPQGQDASSDPYDTDEYLYAKRRLTDLLTEGPPEYHPKNAGFMQHLAMAGDPSGHAEDRWWSRQRDQYDAQRQAWEERVRGYDTLADTLKPRGLMYSPGGILDPRTQKIIPGTEPPGEKPHPVDRYLHGDSFYDTKKGRWLTAPGAKPRGVNPWPKEVTPGNVLVGPDEQGKIGPIYTAPGGKPIRTPQQEIDDKVNQAWLEAYQGVITNATKDPIAGAIAGNDPTALRQRAITIANQTAEDLRARMQVPEAPQQNALGTERQMYSPAQTPWPSGGPPATPPIPVVPQAPTIPGSPAAPRPTGAPSDRLPETLPPAEDTDFWDDVEHRAIQLTLTGMDEDEATEQAILDMLEMHGYNTPRPQQSAPPQ